MNMLARAFVPPSFEVVIPCSAGGHSVSVIGGIPQPGPHDSGDERALAVLAGDKPTCVLARDTIVRISSPATPRITDNLRRPDPIIKTFPEALKRLALLAWAHRDIETTVWQSAVANVSKFARTIVAKEAINLHIGDGIAFDLRDGPAVHWPHSDRGKPTVVLARDWPATVFMFGLETFEERLTLAARFTRAGVVLSQLETKPRAHVIECEVSYEKAMPGYVVLDGARA